MDALSRIERAYGCVAEYNRCCEEEESHNYEKRMKRLRKYEANRREIIEYRKEGLSGIAEAFCGADECLLCQKRTETFYQDENDDIGVFFRLDKNCAIAKH